MRLRFTKMHGLGNDFVVFDGIRQTIALDPDQLRFIADRHFGVGCDQILLVERAADPAVDFRYRIFNADGGEVQQCGNGARCFVRFVHDKGLTDKNEIRVETASGIIVPRLEADGQVTVDMGPPRFEPAEIPFLAETRQLVYPVEVAGEDLEISALSMGNPHAVVLVADIGKAPVQTLGPAIECHARFPDRVNAGFMQAVDRGQIKLRVYERGSGETLACGTGACAAVVSGVERGLLDDHVTVQLPGGELQISWEGDDTPVTMTGPATTVFEGQYRPPRELPR
jgi:diaminopimelate epimerase